MTSAVLTPDLRLAFIGGGNMASAILGGLIRQGLPAAHLQVVEPFEPARARLSQLGVGVQPAASEVLAGIDLLVWAVKPQSFAEAATAVAPQLRPGTPQLSVMAGIRAADIAAATGQARIVRCMPNTPALVGRGMTGLFAATDAASDRVLAEAVIRTTGEVLWVEREELLDAVTAISGSGPAYVFYFLEALQQAGTELGLTAEQARRLAIGTFAGSAQLAADSPEPLATLRERVTSKGGTTYAALTTLAEAGVGPAIVRAAHAAARRAKALGDEFGRGANA